MIAFLFPGQGSQKRGMGRELFGRPEYAAVEREVDDLLGYSLRTLCLEDHENRLKQTQFTQPCLYVVNALHHYAALSHGTLPAYVAGHSLGEYNALLAAGVFDFMTGLRLVKMRGELLARAPNGGMAAVIGLSPTKTEEVIKNNGLTSIDVANFNSPSQTVVSGPWDVISRVGSCFEKSGAQMFMPLQVSAAFHSRYMADAAAAFAKFLAPMSFSPPRLPIVANATADVYPTQNASEAVKAMLVKQITHPVQWTRSIRFMQSRGVAEFKEIGPGNVLARLVQQIQQAPHG